MTTRLGAKVFLRQSRIERTDGRDVMQTYRDPLLVLCGENDIITPVAISRELAAMVPDSTLVIVPECGHLAPLEKPAAVTTALLEWLIA